MAKIVILGAGVMGSAFGQLLADTGQEVRLVGTHLDRDWIDTIRKDGIHPKLGVKLSERIETYTHDQLSTALNDKIDLIVFGVNSAGIDWAIHQVGPLLDAPLPALIVDQGAGGSK